MIARTASAARGEAGFAVHMGLVALVVLALVGWFTAWWVPLAIVALAVGGTWIAWWLERPRVPPGRHPCPEGCRGGHAEGEVHAPTRCEACGESVFRVVPGRTNADEIRAFARRAEGWRGNPDALEGWMPAGAYCPCGRVAIHVTPVPPRPLGGPRQ